MSSRVRASAVAVTARRGTFGKHLGQPAEHAVLGRKSWPHWLTQWASSMAISASGSARQPLQHRGLHQPFGREVEQVQLAGVDAAPDVAARSGSMLESSRSAATPDCCSAATWSVISAISGETTRPRPGRDQRRDLVAEALAAAGRQHGQGAAARQHLADHPACRPRKSAWPKGAAQDVARLAQRGDVVADLGGWGIEGHGDVCNAIASAAKWFSRRLRR